MFLAQFFLFWAKMRNREDAFAQPDIARDVLLIHSHIRAHAPARIYGFFTFSGDNTLYDNSALTPLCSTVLLPTHVLLEFPRIRTCLATPLKSKVAWLRSPWTRSAGIARQQPSDILKVMPFASNSHRARLPGIPFH